MKKQILSLWMLFFTTLFYAQQIQNQWIWIGGSKNASEAIAEFGLTGVEDANNIPDGRSFSSCFTDNSGHLIMFGGAIGNISTLNEMWSFDIASNNWTFKKGIINASNTLAAEYNKGVGIEHYRNIPRDRCNTPSWKDNAGNLWIFSGLVNVSGAAKNDLWKYNIQTNNWILIHEGTQDGLGSFGTKGVESPTNIPPALDYATTWTDLNGNLWLFGGEDTDGNNTISSGGNSYNALWKYSIATGNWTWMGGSNTIDAHGTYGPVGVESGSSQPGARSNSGSWTDNAGYLWLFGGNGYGTTTSGAHNDLWKFNPNTNLWTWVKGAATATENVVTVGTENANNMPLPVNGYRKAYWKDANGNFWYYEGSSNGRMWMYNPLTNAWVLKSQVIATAEAYGTLGVFSSTNTPWKRVFPNQWVGNDGNLYLLGGRGNNDVQDYNGSLWKYDTQINQWAWIKGPGSTAQASGEGQKINVVGNAFEEVHPGYMNNYGAKWNDADGNLWAFGIMGEGYHNSGVNSFLWKYDSSANQWKFIKGNFSKLGYSFNFDGQMGVESPNNYPKPRTDAVSWVDNNQNLWLFGGANSYYYNDLWKYNRTTNNWVWVNGSTQNSPIGNYGTMGVINATNMPGGRVHAASWKDNSGNFWLFGGSGVTGLLNDLWKYDVGLNQWVWMKGSNITGQAEVSAGEGITSPTNTPGTSYYGISYWPASNGIFWLYSKGDMWKFDGSNWTKVKSNVPISYGTIGIPTIYTSPGARISAATWIDLDGNLVLFGGKDSFGDRYEDMWKYTIATNLWTWIGGRKFDYQELPANYGVMNEAFISNVPGSRVNAISWKDSLGNFLLYGGDGWDEISNIGDLSDVWKSNRNFNTISGTVKLNTNNNNCLNSTVAVVDAKITIHSASGDKETFTNTTGNFIEIAQSNSVTLTPELPYFTFSPPSQVVNFTGFGNNQLVNFCATANGVHNDLEVTIIPVTQTVPGFNATYKIIYKNKGTTTLSGSLQFNYQANAFQFVSASLTPQSQSAGVLSWDYATLVPFESRSITVVLTVNTPTAPSPVTAGMVLPFTATLTPSGSDETPGNNTTTLNVTAINALDPNDKNCLEGAVISPAMVGKYVNYIIRFENTGTANATHIVVSDLIDTAKFDVASIQPVAGSHNYRMFVTEGNKVSFVFENINLPYPPSISRYGYIVFRIKTLSTLVAGDVFANQAAIYFDYNTPVITNSYETAIQALGIKENEWDKITLYPNPARNAVTINLNEPIQKVEIFDLNGRIIQSLHPENTTIDTGQLQKGVYLVKVYSADKFSLTKLIKE